MVGVTFCVVEFSYTRCLAEKVCGLVRSTWGASQGEDKLGARDEILNTKVVRRVRAGCAPGKHSTSIPLIYSSSLLAVGQQSSYPRSGGWEERGWQSRFNTLFVLS